MKEKQKLDLTIQERKRKLSVKNKRKENYKLFTCNINLGGAKSK